MVIQEMKELVQLIHGFILYGITRLGLSSPLQKVPLLINLLQFVGEHV